MDRDGGMYGCTVIPLYYFLEFEANPFLRDGNGAGLASTVDPRSFWTKHGHGPSQVKNCCYYTFSNG